MAQPRNESFGPIGATLKKVAQALREADTPFLLGGSVSCWARGGPESSHDVDIMLREQDAERAFEALVDAGLRGERPPEDWLLKAYDEEDGEEVLVDLIFLAQQLPITDEVLERGDELNVLGVTMRVMALEDVLSTKLLALGEHALDLEPLLQIVRSLREQIDWDEVRGRTEASPYARAFFTLVDGLGLTAEGVTVTAAPGPGSPRATAA